MHSSCSTQSFTQIFSTVTHTNPLNCAIVGLGSICPCTLSGSIAEYVGDGPVSPGYLTGGFRRDRMPSCDIRGRHG